MTEMTLEKAREIISRGDPHPQFECDRVPDFMEAQGFMERDRQLRPLIEELVKGVETHYCKDDKDNFLRCFNCLALTEAHKAGFGKKVPHAS